MDIGAVAVGDRDPDHVGRCVRSPRRAHRLPLGLLLAGLRARQPDVPAGARDRAHGRRTGTNLIMVNQFGQRFWNEVDDSHRLLRRRAGQPRRHREAQRRRPDLGDLRRRRRSSARSGSRQPPHVDPDGYFFSADTIAELAAKIKNPYQKRPMSGEALQATVNRYNALRRRPASTPISTSRRRCTRSRSRRSMRPGRRRSCTTR